MAEDTKALAAELAELRAENARLAAEVAFENGRFRALLENASVPMLVTSFEFGRFLDLNQAYADYMGFSREEILAYDPYRFWVETTHPDDFDAERSVIQRLADGEIEGYALEKRVILKDKRVCWAVLKASVVRSEQGHLRYMVMQLTDLQERRAAAAKREELEARLQQSQKLEAIGRLVGGVAHDFNNRLLVIMGYAELLKRGTAADPVLESHADLVLSSSQRAADLTRQLLAYSRRQVLRPRATDLNAIVDGMRRMLERLIGEQVELETVLGAQTLMLADPGQVEQVVMNLMLNARDAMPQGGRVTVVTGDTSVTAAAPVADLTPGDYVSLAVSDTGTGIPEAARPHIFEPFFTTKELGKGTGLGLATVDGIVRQSGGSIAVTSVEGVGSTFTVYLPRATETAPSDKPPPADPKTRLKDIETVLIVDDEDDVRRLLVDVIRIGAYRVLEAVDGQEALEVAARHGGSIDLLVTDLVMPRIAGMELADRLRETQPNLKVLFMSGYAEREHLRALHPNEQFIPKPFLPADLFRRVNDFLRDHPSSPRRP
jgi:two-component system, cell cycle sensor histidine kinase and response regulator CckA